MIESLSRLFDSLDATNVLSDDYKRTIRGYALKIAEEAADSARSRERKRILHNAELTVAVAIKESVPAYYVDPSDHTITLADDVSARAQMATAIIRALEKR